MGNNAAYTTFERMVIDLYDDGVLTPRVLNNLGEMYRGTDIDSGGSRDLVTQDNKGVEQVVVEIMQPGVVPDPDPDFPEEGPYWYSAFKEITWETWGWG